MNTALLAFTLAAGLAAQNVNYTYDAAGPLTRADYGEAGSIRYTYDAAGNLLNRTVTATAAETFATISSASFAAGQAPAMIVTGFGQNLATGLQVAGAGPSANGTVEIERVSPGLYSANQQGTGVAAAFFLRIAADGARTQELLFNPATFAAVPVNLGSAGDQVYLLLFGTGVRGFAGDPTVTVDGQPVALLGAVPQGEFAGLDQINVGPLPRTLIGKGEVAIRRAVDGKTANPVTVAVQ